MIEFFVVLGLALFALGLSGAFASRHLVLVILSTEMMIMAGSLVGIGMFDYFGGSIIPFLFSIWAIAAVGILLLVLFYRYMAVYDTSLEVGVVSKLKR
jgi:hypothetical protein